MQTRRGQRGFGLLECFFILGIAALVIVLSYPSYKRQGLIAKAERLRDELVEIEQAVTAATLSLKAPAGALLTFAQIAPHLHAPAASFKQGLDPFGNAYGTQLNDHKPTVPAKSAEQLRGVVPVGFWGGFSAAGEP